MIDMEINSPNHPTFVGRFLREKGFTHFTEITKLGKFRFKVETDAEAEIRRLKLSEANLRIYEPKNRNNIITFIRGVPTSFEEEEMKMNSEAELPITNIQRIKRQGRKGELLDTPNIKVTFEGTQVPKWMKIYGCNFRPELYIFPIRQCKNCWRFGHGSKFCTGRTKCGTCGGNHPSADCKTDAKCPNCKLKHTANDPLCPERQRHSKIWETMKRRQMTFAQAVTQFPKLQNRFNLLEEMDDEEHENSFPLLEGNRPPKPTSERRRNQLDAYRGKSRSHSRETLNEEFETISSEEETTTSQHKEPRTSRSNFLVNPLKATEFERFIAWLRQVYLTETQQKRRLITTLTALKDLQQKITQRAQSSYSELDRDFFFIEIGRDIQAILEQHPKSLGDTTRTNTASNSGV